MSDIATISLRVNTSELERGNLALDNFQQSAEKSAKAADSFGDSNKATSSKVDELSRSVNESHRRISDFAQRLNTSETAATKLAEKQDKLAKSFFKQIDAIREVEGASAKLKNIQAELNRANRAGELGQGNYIALLGETTDKLGQAEKAEARLNTVRVEFIRRLKEQLAAQTLSREELLRYKAAQLGISSSADIYIKKLSESNNALSSLKNNSASTRREVGMLAAQMVRGDFAGMRNSLITMIGRSDLVQQLASSNSLSAVFETLKRELLGIKSASDESEESLSENANALSDNVENGQNFIGILTPTRLVVGGLAAAVTALGYAYYKGASEQDAFNTSLILTGNIVGKTSGQLVDMSFKVARAAGSTVSDAAGVLNQLVSEGKVAGESLDIAATAILNISDAAGIATGQLVADFNAIAANPVEAIAKLNEKYHFLTLATYNQIKALQEEGKHQEAAKLATETYANAVNEKGQHVQNSLGSLEKAWRIVADAAKGAWDSMLDIGRSRGPEEQIANIQKKITALDNMKITGVVSAIGYMYRDEEKARLQQQMNTLQSMKGVQEGLTKIASERRNAEDKAIKTQQEADRANQQFMSNAEKRNKAIQEQKKFLDAGAISADQYAKNISRINEMYKDPKTPKGKSYTDDAATKMLLESKQRLASLHEQMGATSQLTEQERRLAEFTQQITELKEKRILTADQKSILARSEEIKASLELESSESRRLKNAEELAKGHETALKFIQQQEAAISAMQDSAGMSNRDAQRNREREQTKMMKASPEDRDSALAKLEERYQKDDELRGDWLMGAKKGWSEYLDSATNTYSAMSSVAQSALGGMSSMLTDLVTTGTTSFKQFTVSILKMIVEIINKMLVAYAVQQAMGWMAGGSSAGGAAPVQAWNGGYISEYAGGGYTGDGGKYEPKGVVHGGEFVFTKEATRNIGVGNLYAMMRNAQGYAEGGIVGNAPMYGLSASGMKGGSGSINVQANVQVITQGGKDNSESSNNADVAEAFNKTINQTIKDGVAKELRQGGMIWLAMNKR
ncbi:phage tail tape measure protein [Limnobaculum xujianqingii]|uniref:phage tail tape measure protein n=1 Tax=Limnobaculum xujianqingii TaxID=2738837 RepID=UPI001128358B|nr:phage tail tape measure protein [Limnobaculum xujianqingii]